MTEKNLDFLDKLKSLLSDFKIHNLNLNAKNTILFVDIDDTLFKTTAKVIVEDKDTNEEIKQLDSMEFNTYKLQPNEKYNFKQFKDSKIFNDTAKVINSTVRKLHNFQKTFKNAEGYDHNKIIFITARADMNDKNIFLHSFIKAGIKVGDKSRVYIRRSGSELLNDSESIHEAKTRIMKEYLNSYPYEKAVFFDDSKDNLKSFMSLENEFNNTEFIAIEVSSGLLYKWSKKKKQIKPIA